VIFGSGTIAQTAAEIEKLGHVRSLVLSTANQKTDAEALAHRLAALCVGVFADAAMHTPVHVTELALAEAGRPPGSAKRSPSAPARDQVVIPTTYAGSEMTDILGETVGGEKTTRICLRPSVPGAKRAPWPQPRPLARGRVALSIVR
jgi:maleylacetate reductase